MKNINGSLTPEEVEGFKDLLKALDELTPPPPPPTKTFEEFLSEQNQTNPPPP